MKLIPMTDFVLDQGLNIFQNDTDAFIKSHNYAEFLKQPLELWMFVPCVDNELFNYSKHGNKEHYEQAKRNVMFEGFEIVHIDDYRVTIEYEYFQIDFNRATERFENYHYVSDITTYGFILTETAIKQLGL